MNTKQQPFLVPSGESRSRKVHGRLGGDVAVKVSAADTQGVFVVFEVPVAPNSGPSLHVHHSQDEWFYVVEGKMKFKVGEQLFQVSASGSVFVPRMVPHAFQNVGPTEARILAIAQPAGGLEAFLEEMEGVSAAGPPQLATLTALFAKYDMKLLGPPLSAAQA